MEQLKEKLKELGFEFPQPEFAIHGKFKVVIDCYPYLAESGQGEAIFFCEWNEFIVWYNSLN